MSEDAQMAVIGRMVTERKRLGEKRVALSEEVERIAREFERLGNKLLKINRLHGPRDFSLSPEDLALMDSEKITSLLSDLEETEKRLADLSSRLNEAGL
jgi:hypothetical protein